MSDLLLMAEHTSDDTVRYAGFLTTLIPLIIFPLFAKNQPDLAQKYFLRVTPPGIFFTIWIVIIIVYDTAALYAVVNNVWSTKAWVAYGITNGTIGLWTVVFSTGKLEAVCWATLIEVVLVIANQELWINLTLNPHLTGWTGLWLRNVPAFGTGWFIAATSLGLGIILVYYFKLKLSQQATIFWIVTPLAYELFFWSNLTIGPFQNSILLIATTLWAITGAAISTLKPLPVNKLHLEEERKEE